MPTDTAPASNPVERLTDQFYDWERRGRGWRVWDEAVDLEPPFRPFRFHALPTRDPGTDDGQRPTILSRLADRVIGALSRRAAAATSLAEDEDAKEAVPQACCPDEPFTELRLSLPQGVDVSLEQVEQFVLSLPHPARPFAFEMIGTAESITVQLCAGHSERANLETQLRAHFPSAALLEAPQGLEAAWSAPASGHAVVVEFGLSEEFMVPLRVLRRFAVDPLSGIGAALSDLAPEEVGVLQVLFQPVRHPWARSIVRSVLDDSGSPFFLDAPEITALAREKVAHPLFAVVIRAAGRSGSPERSRLVARSIGWGLRALANPPANGLIPLSNDGYPPAAHEQDLLARRSRRSGMILSSGELVSLVHPPSASVQLEKLLREGARTRPAPPIASGHAYVLGMNGHGGRQLEVSLSEEQRSRHLYLVGASGTGKSTLMLKLILQDLDAGRGMAVLDPHGDLVDEIVRRLPPKRLEDVVLLDPSDGEFPIGFNILQARTELERTLLASDLVAVFRRLSTSWGDQMTSVLGNAILAFLESERGGTLVDLRRFLVEPKFRAEFLTTVRDPEVVYYWQREFPLLAGKPQAPLLTRLDIFLRPKPIRYMVAQKDSRLDLRHVMNEGKVLLARLSQGAIGEENAYLLGTLLVSKLHQLAMSRQELAAAERRPFYLYIDEFHNFITPSMEQILSGARKYRLGLVLAHQDLRQIQSRSMDVLNSVLSNPYARVCFRVGDQDARTLAEGFQHFDARDLQSLSTGRAVARVERSEYDFNLATAMLPAVDDASGAAAREQVVARTRERYGMPRAEIEALLSRPGGEPGVELRSVEVPTPPSPPRRERAGAESPAVPALVSRPPPAVEIPTPASSPGRGGKQHKYLQSLICRWADAHDWRATVEERVLDGLGSVDVALRMAEHAIACEIGVTTSPEHEVQNIQKCLAAGFQRVLVVSPEKRTLNRIRAEAAQTLDDDQAAHVSYCSPEELFELLDSIAATELAKEQTVRGYRVKVRIKPGSAAAKDERRGTVSAVIARAMKRMKRK